MDKNSRIYIAGHKGLIGSAILRRLKVQGYKNFILRTHEELDLTNQQNVESFFNETNPEYVFLAAAIVGGIWVNSTRSGEFIYSNLQIQTSVIHASMKYDVKKLLFIGSSCIYPKYCPQPITENCLLSAHLEPTNIAYAIAKIAGIIMCQSYNKQYGTKFICAMPTNAYGPNDTYALDRAHVLPALIRKFYEAERSKEAEVNLWGTGTPLREFIYSDDLANACILLMEKYSGDEIINVGTGEEISIRDLAYKIAEMVGYTGTIWFDSRMPDGVPRKLLDSSKIRLMGWKPKYKLSHGISKTYSDFKENICRS